MIVQAVTDVYYQHEGMGFVLHEGGESENQEDQCSGAAGKMMGMDRNGNLVDGRETVLVVSLKVVDIVLDEPPKVRVAIMQEIGRHWSVIIEKVCHGVYCGEMMCVISAPCVEASY